MKHMHFINVCATSMATARLNQTLIVTTINHGAAAPIASLYEGGRSGYYGFGIELLDMISWNIGVKYKIFMANSKSTGQLIDLNSGKWSGMIGEVIEGRADIALAAMTMDTQRAAYVDFTMPFKDLGIGILYITPKSRPPDLFSFFQVLSPETWVGCFISLLTFSLLFYLFTKFDNSLEIGSAIWLCLSAILRQGCRLQSTSLSSKFTEMSWWLFTLIIATLFMANFTTYLTLPAYDIPFKDFDGLTKQTKVKYGFHSTGSIGLLFKNSPKKSYQNIWKNAHNFNQTNQVLFPGNDPGVREVLARNGKFAFVADLPILDAAVSKFCKLARVGSIESRKWWSIPMRKGSELKGHFNQEIIRVMEHGLLDYLDQKWMNRGSRKLCKFDLDQQGFQILELANVGGVFLLYAAGGLVTALIICIEYIWNSYINSRWTLMSSKVDVFITSG